MPIAKVLLPLGAAGVLASGLATQDSPATQTLNSLLKPLEELQSTALGAVKTGIGFLATTIGAVVPYDVEVMPNGDIMIRRVPPSGDLPPADPGSGETQTKA